jgi:hypothetical protein
LTDTSNWNMHDLDDVPAAAAPHHAVPPAPDNVLLPTGSPIFSAGAIAANKERQEREEENAPFHDVLLIVHANCVSQPTKKPMKKNVLASKITLWSRTTRLTSWKCSMLLARKRIMHFGWRAGILQPKPFHLVSTKVCEMKQPESWPKRKR